MDTLLFQRFGFRKPIEIEDLPDGQGSEIVALAEKTIIKMDKEAEDKDIAEILSKAKLAEIDPLIATFFFQKDMTKDEEILAYKFFQLCQPLQDAWTYKIMRRYAPDIYTAEIDELLVYWHALLKSIRKDGILKETNIQVRRQVLGMFAILYENTANKIELVIKTDEANRADWDGYVSALKDFIHKEPATELYLRLSISSNAPYSVDIADDNGFRHYKIWAKNSKLRKAINFGI